MQSAAYEDVARYILEPLYDDAQNGNGNMLVEECVAIAVRVANLRGSHDASESIIGIKKALWEESTESSIETMKTLKYGCSSNVLNNRLSSMRESLMKMKEGGHLSVYRPDPEDLLKKGTPGAALFAKLIYSLSDSIYFETTPILGLLAAASQTTWWAATRLSPEDKHQCKSFIEKVVHVRRNAITSGILEATRFSTSEIVPTSHWRDHWESSVLRRCFLSPMWSGSPWLYKVAEALYSIKTDVTCSKMVTADRLIKCLLATEGLDLSDQDRIDFKSWVHHDGYNISDTMDLFMKLFGVSRFVMKNIGAEAETESVDITLVTLFFMRVNHMPYDTGTYRRLSAVCASLQRSTNSISPSVIDFLYMAQR